MVGSGVSSMSPSGASVLSSPPNPGGPEITVRSSPLSSSSMVGTCAGRALPPPPPLPPALPASGSGLVVPVPSSPNPAASRLRSFMRKMTLFSSVNSERARTS